VRPADVELLIDRVRAAAPTAALILTSFHQSPLPLALLLRLAGVPWLGAISHDYPGTLLDLRHQVDENVDVPEPERALDLARAAGFRLPEGDRGRLMVRWPLPEVTALTGPPPYVVVHPGTSVPARRWPAERHAEAVRELVGRGHRVVVTGSRNEHAITARVAGRHGADLGGRTSLAQLAAVLAGADAVVVANTGPAHLAAAVGTPVFSLFAPTVSAARWAPYGVPVTLLGDQSAPCASSRATDCQVPGHPCLAAVTAADVVVAVEKRSAVIA
jgi:ADP-heptose:LPS heptosyltransferase